MKVPSPNPLRAALDLARAFVDGVVEGVTRRPMNRDVDVCVLLHALWESADEVGARLLVSVNGVRYERENAPIALDDTDWLSISRMGAAADVFTGVFWFNWEGAAGTAHPHLNALGVRLADELRRKS